MAEIKYIDEVELTGKTILVRVDFDVTLNPNNFTIADDARIRQNVPTLQYLLDRGNKIICVAKLNRPKQRDPQHSLKIVTERLSDYLPGHKITLINDFLTEPKETFQNQQPGEIFVLENIRFYPEEKKNDPEFAKKLAALAEIFVNDGFAVSHRAEASVVGIPQYLPSYGGLLLKKEVQMLSKVLKNPEKPLVAIIGGAKIETKIKVLDRLMDLADYLIIGGALANTFLYAQGFDVGASFFEADKKDIAQQLLTKAKENNKTIILPSDCIVGSPKELERGGQMFKVKDVPHDQQILDIGPETKARIGAIITKAKTIVWNGPVGYFENPHYRQGTDFMYYMITQNEEAESIVGGGDTLAAISKMEYLDKITHISTGGGAMLEFIELGTLPGIEALKK